ncbi:MAG TPA: glycosyltransferase [Firmicutes bacterium]|nr:glycosyltransferase [Bacillota bacterium]
MVSSAHRADFSEVRKILGFRVNIINLEETVELVEKLLASSLEKQGKRRVRIVTLNPEMLMMGVKDPQLFVALQSADLVVPDGIGVVWALRRTGVKQQQRVTGIDLVEKVIARQTNGLRIYLLGGKPGVVEVAALNLVRRWPAVKVAGSYHGYFPPEENQKIIQDINQVRPDLLLVGMGVPRQEIWLHSHWQALEASVGIGVGGLFDVWAGRVKRAPKILRNMGLEWVYRAWKEPERCKRLLVLPEFMSRVWRERLTSRQR